MYLGHKLSNTKYQKRAVKHRIGLGWDAFGKLEKVLKSIRVPVNVKTKVYLPCCIIRFKLHHMQQNNINKREVFQNQILRIITGPRQIDKIKITRLRDITKIPAYFDSVESKTLKLYGHIER